MANLNINKSIIGGRIASEVNLKATQNGTFVCSFTIAVSRKGKREETDFINCVAWRSMAEFISKHFHKGSSICIVGNIQTRSWEDGDGKKKYATEVIVDEASFVDSKSESIASESPAEVIPTTETEGFLDVTDEQLPPFFN